MTPEYNPYKVASFQLTDDWLACCIEKARIDSMDLSMPEAVRAINQNNINYDLILSRNETLVGAMLRLPPRSTQMLRNDPDFRLFERVPHAVGDAKAKPPR